jgi:hypothetical protein
VNDGVVVVKFNSFFQRLPSAQFIVLHKGCLCDTSRKTSQPIH